MNQALVKNAGDPDQVKEGKRKEKFNREDALQDVRNVLAEKSGRRFLYSIIYHCGVFQTIWHGSALIHYQSGCQDMGFFIVNLLKEADRTAYLLMLDENLT
jgi:hypothetical protein